MNRIIVLEIVFVLCFVVAVAISLRYFGQIRQGAAVDTGEPVALAAQAYVSYDNPLKSAAYMADGTLQEGTGQGRYDSPVMDEPMDEPDCLVTSEGKVFYAVEGKERLVSEYDPVTNTLTLVVMYDGAVRGELIRVKLDDRTVEASRVAGWKVGGR